MLTCESSIFFRCVPGAFHMRHPSKVRSFLFAGKANLRCLAGMGHVSVMRFQAGCRMHDKHSASKEPDITCSLYKGAGLIVIRTEKSHLYTATYTEVL